MSRAAMVTVIHVVDTLEPTQSLPPVAAIPRSVCLCRRPPCVPGRVTVQSATTKEEARHCYRKRRRTKALFTPPHPHPPNIPPAPLITFVGEAWETTRKHKADRARSNFVFFLPSHSGDVYVYMPTTSSAEHSSAAHLPLVQDKVGF